MKKRGRVGIGLLPHSVSAAPILRACMRWRIHYSIMEATKAAKGCGFRSFAMLCGK
ncbi:hypothetical protein EDF19_2148 [Curtobacterium sp. PhB115]|nr:hypothetical protein EDF19_2148 [Curtobacterium sp. PhB115]